MNERIKQLAGMILKNTLDRIKTAFAGVGIPNRVKGVAE